MVGYNKFESERFFVETMNRILKSRSEYKVLYINISKLKLKNRHPRFVRIVARMFDNMVAIADGTMFVFSSGDIAILGKNIDEKLVDEATEKLRSGLLTDPIWVNQDSEKLVQLYTGNDFDALMGQVNETILNGAEVAMPHDPAPIDAGQIEAIKNHIDTMDLIDLVKHQSVIRFDASDKFTKLFEEFFVAVKDLSSRFDRDIDLTANKWLFLYLTQTLDKKTMASFAFSELHNNKTKVSINLNLSSLFTPEFDKFTELLKEKGQGLIVEVHTIDILNNMQAYFDAKELLHRAGYEILLDAADIEMLQSLNIKKFAPDYIKIFWHPLLEDYEIGDNIKNLFAEIGVEKIILAKTINETALRWGVKHKIRTFQGPYIDNLETAIIRSKCPNGKLCSASECHKRRKLIAGIVRNQCAHPEYLEGGVEI